MHDKVAMPSLTYCPNCHEAMKPHQVCLSCGNYKGVNVISKQETVKIKEEVAK